MPELTDHEAEPTFGAGIFSFPAASRLLQSRDPDVTIGQLRYWIKSGLTPLAYARSGTSDLLSFKDLMSLEVVRRLRTAGASLQGIRRAETEMRHQHPEQDRPFAYKQFFTDGSAIWASSNPSDDQVLELHGRRRGHIAWKPAIATFATEIRYKDDVAASWALTEWVEVDPAIQFGEPVIRGTRIPLSTIEAELEIATADDVADWHGLDPQLVRAVRASRAA
jgi:uncharacterized protein (DUF433 family)